MAPMNNPTLFSMLVAGCLLSVSTPTWAGWDDSFLLATVQGEAVMVAVPPKSIEEPFRLLKRNTASVADKVSEYFIHCLEPGMFMRWRLSHDCVWGTGGSVIGNRSLDRIPLQDLDCFEFSRIQKEGNPLALKYPHLLNHDKLIMWLPRVLADVELHHRLERSGKGLEPLTTLKDHAFDFVPTAQNALDLYLLRKKTMEVWQMNEGRFDLMAEEWRHKESKKPVRSYSSPFCEQFIVYRIDKGQNFFVTHSGKVFTDRPLDEKKPQLAPFFDLADHPLEAIVTDADSHRTFVFGSLDAKKRRFVFELAPKLAVRYFDSSEIKPVKARPPLDQTLGYVNFLKNTRRLKDK